MRKSMHLGRAAAAGGLIVCALALGAHSAGAATIHACVNRHSGSARLVGAHARCRHRERSVSWNTIGPSGVPGAAGRPGTNGTNGTNGAGVDYGAASPNLVMLGEGETGSVVASRTIPAGSYFVSAKTVVGAIKGKAATFLAVICELVDTTGTPSITEAASALDAAEWVGQLANSGTEFGGATTLALQGQLTTTQPTTLALLCGVAVGAKEATFLAVSSQLNALQTTANK